VIFIFLTTVVVAKKLQDDGKTPDNSKDPIPDKYPFLVGVISSKHNEDQIVCTGTLISLNFVLTSAYCALSLQPKIQVSAQNRP
jgi:V8-like Glu-specific endopeptidase